MEYGFNNPCPEEFSSEAPNKRPKTKNEENSPFRSPSPSQSGPILNFIKGKSKLEPERESIVCGICLSEAVDDGNNVCRGYIDSCDHYFCFVCIMEWAKIESTCPLCKRRFSNIRRPSKPPLFPCERLVHVPVRDQADYLSGGDLYSTVQCTVCHSSADDCFLLLCDLCDSASHTYCVGLGSTVPEGDWFCRDCTLLRAERTQSELDAESEELRNSGNVHGLSEDISMFDIVRAPESHIRRERSSERTQNTLDVKSNELSNSTNLDGNPNSSPESMTVLDIARGHESPIRTVERSSEHTQSEQGIESSELSNSGSPNCSPKNITVFDIVRGPESPIRRVERSSEHTKSELENESPIRRVVQSSTNSFSNDRIGMDKRGQANNAQDSSRLSARTLQQRRNVLDRIQGLRDNWSSFRIGSLNFSSSSSSCTTQSREVSSNSTRPHSIPSMCERLNSENGPLVSTENRSVREIDKAWKMMHMAKSLEKKRGRKSIPKQASRSPLSSKHLSANDKLSGSVNLGSIRKEKQSLHHNLVNNSSKNRTQILEKQSLPVQRSQNCNTGLPISSSPVYFKLTSPQETSSPFQNDLCSSSRGNLPKKIEGASVLTASSDHCSKPVSLSSSGSSTPVASNLSHAKLKLPAFSSSKVEPHMCKDTGAKEKSSVDLKNQGTNDAKSEIQSIVKLNLKLLTKDKHLGVNTFKEVARSATHSILATCGLEHPKPGIRLFPSSACRHASDGLDIRRSTLIPNSCRECFYLFVKDVVSTIMLEKVEGAEVS